MRVFEDKPVYLAEIQVRLRVDRRRRHDWLKVPVTKSELAEKVFRLIWEDDIAVRERCYMVVLNSGNLIQGYFCLSSGGLNCAVVDPRLVYGVANRACGTAVMIAHNHPSGTLEPSENDLRLTQRLIKAGDLLGIEFLDHLILSPEEGYYSMTDNGNLKA